MSGKKNVCLNMIVKNEIKVIRRCLNSVKHLIDYWLIVDTGSTDGTQARIKEILKDIPENYTNGPGKILNIIEMRRSSWPIRKPNLLFIDADEELKIPKPLTSVRWIRIFI